MCKGDTPPNTSLSSPTLYPTSPTERHGCPLPPIFLPEALFSLLLGPVQSPFALLTPIVLWVNTHARPGRGFDPVLCPLRAVLLLVIHHSGTPTKL